MSDDDDLDVEIAGEPTRADASFGELGELLTWQRLIDLANEAGSASLASAFRAALEDERR